MYKLVGLTGFAPTPKRTVFFENSFFERRKLKTRIKIQLNFFEKKIVFI